MLPAIIVSVPQFAHLLLTLMANKTTFFLFWYFPSPFSDAIFQIRNQQMETHPGIQFIFQNFMFWYVQFDIFNFVWLT